MSMRKFNEFCDSFKRSAKGTYANGDWVVRKASLGNVWRLYYAGDWKGEHKNLHYAKTQAFYLNEEM